jgi:membrane protein implicated in regulation of membrane protease activity
MPTIFYLWLAAMVIFLIIEIFTPSLVFACVAVGALGGAITSVITDSYLIQLGVFAFLTILLIPLTRPLAKKITKESPQKTNVDAMVGKKGMVVKAIDPVAEVGQVRVEGQVWQAIASEPLDVNAKITVDKVQGARLYVSKTINE